MFCTSKRDLHGASTPSHRGHKNKSQRGKERDFACTTCLTCLDTGLNFHQHDRVLSLRRHLEDFWADAAPRCFRNIDDLLRNLWPLQVDYLFNDSFPDSLHWNAVNNFNGLFRFLGNGYVQALLSTLCVVSIGLQDLLLHCFSLTGQRLHETCNLKGTSLPPLLLATLVSVNLCEVFHRGVPRRSRDICCWSIPAESPAGLPVGLLVERQRLWLCRGSLVGLRDSLRCVSATLARQQPHLNNLEPHRSAAMLTKFWYRTCSCGVWRLFRVAWATHGLPSFDGAGVTWVLTRTHQRDAPSRQDDGDIRAPTLLWLVLLCCRDREWCRWRRYPSTHSLGRERVSRCSVDSRRSCTRVLVVVPATNSSASVANPHRLVHVLLHDF